MRLIGWALIIGGLVSAAGAQDERATANRFQKLLEDSPKRGTAFDRVYAFHIENSSLDDYAIQLQSKIADGKAQLLLGMLEARRGDDAAAVKALATASKLLPANPLPPWYRAQSLIAIGKPSDAVNDFEEALTRAQNPTQRLELYKALGRTHQRAYNQTAAVAVWKRMESEFPDNEQVQAEIAIALSEDGLNEEALKRYQQLAAIADDNYRKVNYGIQQAEILLRLGRNDDAVLQLESLSETLKPDGWLHRDVRDRLENVFLQNDDFEGLANYFKLWLQKHPDDVDALARLGHTLSMQGRNEDAEKTLARAVQVAPSNVKLRELLIQSLVRRNQTDQAAQQFAELHRIDPQNSDHLERWGRLLAVDSSKDEAERVTAATAVWRKLLDNNAGDPVRLVRLADLLRSVNQSDAAIDLYRQAIEATPDSTQYLEYLGEYQHRLERTDDALATWQEIVSGDRRTADNLQRYSQILAEFGFDSQAVESMRAAIALDPDRFDLQRGLAGRLIDVQSWDAALQQLQVAEALAENEQDLENIFQMRLDVLRSSGQLAQATSELQQELESGVDVTAKKWVALAKLADAASNTALALQAVRRAVLLDNSSADVASVAAEIFESAGQLSEAAEVRARLAEIDRRFRSVHLTKLAELQLSLGQNDAAYEAGHKVLQLSGAGPEQARFFAQLCFRLGRDEEGFSTLRQNVRLNPADLSVRWVLAQSLGDRFKTEEAIEVYWQAFVRAEELRDKLQTVEQLALLHLRIDRFDRLLDRLQRLSNNDKATQRVTAFCLARAYQTADDLTSAREVLVERLGQDSKDLVLLETLVELAELDYSYIDAMKYQQQVSEIRDSPDADFRLAKLALQASDLEDSLDVISQLMLKTDSLDQRLKIYDEAFSVWADAPRLERRNSQAAIDSLLQAASADFNDHWSVVLRSAILAAEQKRDSVARQEFQRLLTLKVSRSEQDPTQSNSVLASGQSERYRAIVELNGPLMQNPYSGDSWSYFPHRDFGVARLTAIVWLAGTVDDESRVQRLLDDQRKAIETASNRQQAEVDLLELAVLCGRKLKVLDLLVRLSQAGNRDAMYALVMTVQEIVYSEQSIELTPDQLATISDAHITLIREQPQTDIWARLSGHAKFVKSRVSDKDYSEFVSRLQPLAATPDQQGIVLQMLPQNVPVVPELQKLQRLLQIQTRTQPYYEHLDFGLLAALRQMPSQIENGNLQQPLQILDATQQVLDVAEAPQSGQALTLLRGNWYGERTVFTRTNDGWDEDEVSYPPERTFASDLQVQVLHVVYADFQSAGKLPVLEQHLRTRSNADNNEFQNRDSRLMALLNLSWIRAWQDDAVGAFEILQEAQQRFPQNVELLADVVLIKANLSDDSAAARLVDNFTPQNRVQLEIQETLALGLAVKTQDIARAKLAAERLFGLRLDNESALWLRNNLQLLGMDSLALQMSERMRRRAGRSVGDLEELLQSVSYEGNRSLATEIAWEILQRTRPSQNGYPEGPRDTALGYLNRQGQLQQYLDATIAEFDKSPASKRMFQKLSELYYTTDQDAAATELEQRWYAASGNGSVARLAAASRLLEQEDYQAASDMLLQILSSEPDVLESDAAYYWCFPSIQASQRFDELAEILAAMEPSEELKSLTETLAPLLFVQESTLDRGFALLHRLYPDGKSFPIQRYRERPAFWASREAIPFLEGRLSQDLNSTDYEQVIPGKAEGEIFELAQRMERMEQIDSLIQSAMNRQPKSLYPRLCHAKLLSMQGRTTELSVTIDGLLEIDSLTWLQVQWLGQISPKSADLDKKINNWIEGKLLSWAESGKIESGGSDDPNWLFDELSRDYSLRIGIASGQPLFSKIAEIAIPGLAKATAGSASEAEAEDAVERAELLMSWLLNFNLPIDALRVWRVNSDESQRPRLRAALSGRPIDDILKIALTADGQIDYFCESSLRSSGRPATSLIVDVIRAGAKFENINVVLDEFDQAVLNVLQNEDTDQLPDSVAVLEQALKKLPLAKKTAPAVDRRQVLLALADNPTLSVDITAWQPPWSSYSPPTRAQLLGRMQLLKLAAEVLADREDLRLRFRWALRSAEVAWTGGDKMATEEWLNNAMELSRNTRTRNNDQMLIAEPSREDGVVTDDQFERLLSVVVYAQQLGHSDWALAQLQQLLNGAAPVSRFDVNDLASGNPSEIADPSRGQSPLIGQEPFGKHASGLWKLITELRRVAPQEAREILQSLVLPANDQFVHLYVRQDQFQLDTLAELLVKFSIEDRQLSELRQELDRRLAATPDSAQCRLLQLLIARETDDLEAAQSLLTNFAEDARQLSLTQNADHVFLAFALCCRDPRLVEQSLDAVLAAIATEVGRQRFLPGLSGIPLIFDGQLDRAAPGLTARLLIQIENTIKSHTKADVDSDFMVSALPHLLRALPLEDNATRWQGVAERVTRRSSVNHILFAKLQQLDPGHRLDVALKYFYDSKRNVFLNSRSNALPYELAQLNSIPVTTTELPESSVELLVAAAVESGRAGELLTLFDNAKSADEENVFRFARIRLMLASDRIEELRRELTRLAKTVNQRQLIDRPFVDNEDTPEELKIAKLCHADLRLRDEAETLLLSCFRCQLKNECVVVAGGMRAIADSRADHQNTAADQPALKYFSQRNTAIDLVLADEGLLFAASGFPQELQLSFPLQGDFEVEVVFSKAFDSKKGSRFGDFAFPCFGDVVLHNLSESQFFSSFVGIDVEGVSGRYVRALVTMESPAKSVSKLIASGNTVRYQLNGQEVIVDNARPDSYPWLDLQMNGTIQVESVRITGQPEIPRSITLIDGPRLSGWQVASSEFAATGWAPRFSGQPDAVPAKERGSKRLWVVDEQNCLVGVTDSENEDSDESFALTYMRPMNVGEEVEYEFFYEAGRSVVHPMIGDMAFVLSADGIRRRHIRTSSNYRGSGDVAQETTPHLQDDLLQLPLVNKAWNKVSLKWSARSVECWLNGTMVYEYALSSTKPVTFGFHRNPSTDFVRIRNVILQGDWPEQIPEGFVKNPIAPHHSFTTEDQAQNTSTIQFFNDEFIRAEDN